jgi:hypothetical protein
MISRRNFIRSGSGLALAALGSSALPGAASAADLDQDVAILRLAWQSMHPGLYRYTTPGQLPARFKALSASWRDTPSFQSRFASLSRLTASIRCGHTYPSPYNSTKAVVAQLYPGRSLVPFEFRWLGGRIVVTKDRSGEGAFPPGTVVDAIDGVAVAALLKRLLPMSRADGGNDAKRINNMEVKGGDRFEAFDIYLPLVLPNLSETATFTLGDGRQVRARLLTQAERLATLAPSASAAKTANPWRLDHRPDGVAVLTMPGWALYDSGFDWKTWLGAALDDLSTARARGLVVDLRGNEGGLDCGNVILSRLVDRDIPLARNQRWTRYRTAPAELHPYLDTWDKSFLDWGEAAQGPDNNGLYRLRRYDDDGASFVIRPEGQRFKGRVAVLCDASNSSATFGFAIT